MKTVTYQKTIKSFVFAAVMSCCASAHASEKPLIKNQGLSVPQSTFVDKQDAGKDPFFPNSARRRETIARVVPTNNVPQMSALLSKLSLKGISGIKGQPLALINNSTIAEGELAEIRCGQQLVKVRCLEIRDSSVLVELYGTSETRELKLREGI
jgi:hypothetical protein